MPRNAALRSGMLSYWPETENVAFRLDVLSGDRTISASIQFNPTKKFHRDSASGRGEAGTTVIQDDHASQAQPQRQESPASHYCFRRSVD